MITIKETKVVETELDMPNEMTLVYHGEIKKVYLGDLINVCGVEYSTIGIDFENNYMGEPERFAIHLSRVDK